MTFRQKYIYGEDPIELNAGRATLTVSVRNTGDRAVQVGSHFHFFEVNSALSFDRQRTLGMHLNIAAGTAVRFEPGGTKEVELCDFAGAGRLVGFSGLLNGSTASRPARVEAVRRAIELGFQGAQNAVAESGDAGAGPDADERPDADEGKGKPAAKADNADRASKANKAEKHAKPASSSKKGSH